MITKDGKRCDREIGSPAKGWRTCGQPATHDLPAKYGVGSLHYCKRHIEAAKKERKRESSWCL